MSIEPGLPVALALIGLLALAVGVHRWAGYRLEWSALVAAARAIAQLSVIALVIGAVVGSLWLTALLVLVMFAVAVLTTSRRVGDVRLWMPAALAMGAGLVPVLVIILATGSVPQIGRAHV